MPYILLFHISSNLFKSTTYIGLSTTVYVIIGSMWGTYTGGKYSTKAGFYADQLLFVLTDNGAWGGVLFWLRTDFGASLKIWFGWLFNICGGLFLMEG